MRFRLVSWDCPTCAWGATVCRAAAQILFKRTQSSVNNKNQLPASSAFHSYKQVQHGVWLSPLSSSDTPVSLPEGMVVDPVGPGAILRLLQNSTFFLFGVKSKLKGDESRTLLLPAVDDVPAAGHLWGKVTRTPHSQRSAGPDRLCPFGPMSHTVVRGFIPVRVQSSHKARISATATHHTATWWPVKRRTTEQ